MPNENLHLVKTKLQQFIDSAPTGAGSTRLLAESFLADNEDALCEAGTELKVLGVMKLFDGISRRRSHVFAEGQGDLFHGFSHPQAIVVPINVRGKCVGYERKSFHAATFCEVAEWLRRRTRQRSEPKADTGVMAIVDRLKPHVTSPDMTIEEALAAAVAAAAAEHTAVQS
ncbi:MAG: hypothetical protein JWM36_3234 [Hyphomicrobiales bacterium]|nr:hypothetical protein [Hyphomicrobiales bacterium]